MKSVSMKGLVDHRVDEKNRIQEESVKKKVLDQYNVSSHETRGSHSFTMKQPTTTEPSRNRKNSKRKRKRSQCVKMASKD